MTVPSLPTIVITDDMLGDIQPCLHCVVLAEIEAAQLGHAFDRLSERAE